ncbi:fatty acyl-CoA hydrolase precursor, medium chain-like [Lineus longissimus]|uniref:fatty acyl-CoA hydrolase precursor, medium chain-like n=1 Tax=Lineus longissimus TaxID=88925 RepID=UPI00315CB2BD
MMALLLTFVMMVGSTVSSQHLAPVTVETSVGLITGIQEHLRLYGENYQLNAFRGIPYAEPPVGKLRFKRSVPKAPFKDGFNATAYGDACMQKFWADPLHFPDRFPTNEDCLFLNVFTPVSANRTNKKSVMFFIHGGAWIAGASQQYDGRPLAAYGDVVTVTTNYRLGPFGYLSTGDSNGPANNALFDELLALQWVKDNIGEFGGDADTVTVFGQSAGGLDTSLHAISPLSAGRGLLKRAISESCAAIFPHPKHRAIFHNPLEKAKLLAGFLGCPKANHQTMIECMQTKSAQDVLEKGDQVEALFPLFVWGPTIDDEFVPESPINLFNNPNISVFSAFSSIDLMVGSTSADGDADGPDIFSQHLAKNLSTPKSMLVDALSVEHMLGVPNEADVIKAVLQEYVPSVKITDVEAMDILVDYYTDLVFIGPAVATAQTHVKMSKDSKTYVYFFTYALNEWTHSRYRPGLSTHTSELLYIFLFPSLDIDNGTLRQKVTEKDVQLSKAMMSYWTNFAKYGNPNGKISGDLAGVKAEQEWPPFTSENQEYLDLGNSTTDIKLTPRKGLRAKKMSFWLDYLPYLMNKTCSDAPPAQPCPELTSLDIALAVCTAVFGLLSLALLVVVCKGHRENKLKCM